MCVCLCVLGTFQEVNFLIKVLLLNCILIFLSSCRLTFINSTFLSVIFSVPLFNASALFIYNSERVAYLVGISIFLNLFNFSDFFHKSVHRIKYLIQMIKVHCVLYALTNDVYLSHGICNLRREFLKIWFFYVLFRCNFLLLFSFI